MEQGEYITKEKVQQLLVDHLDPVVSGRVVDDLCLDLLRGKQSIREKVGIRKAFENKLLLEF